MRAEAVVNVLVACEESQEVCKAFRERGHRAFSCDLQQCSGGRPEWHIVADASELLDGNCEFRTCDTHTHTQRGRWDLLICHPPCTFLTNAAACRLYQGKEFGGYQKINLERLREGIRARDLFMKMLNADCERIAIENPIPASLFLLPPYTQTIEPYEFGDPWMKRTALWLKNLPPLQPTNIVEPVGSWVSGGSKKPDGTPRENQGEKFRDSKRKSKTFPGIARAMAEQWTDTYQIQQTLF